MRPTNSTERYKRALGVYDRPSAKHDHLTDKNDYWRVSRDINCGSTGDPKLRRTPYPNRNAGNWSRTQRAGIVPIVRFLRLQRMLDARAHTELRHYFRLNRARQIAFGWTIFLAQAREQSRRVAPLTERQKRIAFLVVCHKHKATKRRR